MSVSLDEADIRSLASTHISFDGSEGTGSIFPAPSAIQTDTIEERDERRVDRDSYIEKPDTPCTLNYKDTKSITNTLRVKSRRWIAVVKKISDPDQKLFKYASFLLLFIIFVVLCVHFERQDAKINELFQMVSWIFLPIDGGRDVVCSGW